MTGTMNLNRRNLPAEAKVVGDRELSSNLFFFCAFLPSAIMTAVSYIVKKSKALILLSTNHVTAEIPDNDFKGRPNIKNKSTINLFYNHTKGGVDVIDFMCRVYSAKRGTSRWPMSLFGTMIDIAAINAQTCCQIEGKIPPLIKKRKDFVLELAMELIVPYIYERPSGTLQRNVLDGANTIIKLVNKHRSQTNQLLYVSNKYSAGATEELSEDELQPPDQLTDEQGPPTRRLDQPTDEQGPPTGRPDQPTDEQRPPTGQPDPKIPKKAQKCYLCNPDPSKRANQITRFSSFCVYCGKAVCPNHRSKVVYCTECCTNRPNQPN